MKFISCLFHLELAKNCLIKSDFDFAWTYFDWNCYTLHPEWLLLSMLSDPNEDIRKMAVEKILDYRKSEKPAGVRTRILPKLNKNAKKYYETIGKNSLTSPSIFKNAIKITAMVFSSLQPMVLLVNLF